MVKVKSFFLVDVCDFLEIHAVVFLKDKKFTGKSGFSHEFDFSLPKIRNRNEIAIGAINSPRKDIVGSALWTIQDTQLTRSNTKGLVILVDQNEFASEMYTALEAYKVQYLKW